MRVPQVSERIKEAPAQALRGVFAGIGQLLLITDKLRNKTSAGQDVPRARTPETVTDTPVTSPADQPADAAPAAAAPAAPAAAAPAAPAAPVAPAEAGAVAAEVAPAEPAAEAPPKPPKRQSTRDFDKTGNVRLLNDEADSSPLSAAAPAATPAAGPAAGPVSATEPAAAPPLPSYDELSVPSLRARLRNLDVTQVRQLADYERAHAARADVLTMFERRIAKLEAGA
jgi:hypothetical protein